MMMKIITPDRFVTVPWKNNKGKTTELAISDNGTINDFDWRLSIADVVEDGTFSDFSGFDRNLILLEGQGIKLIHDGHADLLDIPLSISSFNGASKTIGQLINGPIKDFNLMTRQGKYQVEVKTFTEQTTTKIKCNDLCFVYSHTDKIELDSNGCQYSIPKRHLSIINNESEITINANNYILINLKKHFS